MGQAMTQFVGKADHVRRILPAIDPKQFETDLNRLCEMAIESGAETAVAIDAGDVVFNSEVLERVSSDDAFLSVHWPLNYPKDDIIEAVKAYRKGIFFRVTGDKGMPEYGGGPIRNAVHRKKYFKVYEIVTMLESTSFYYGYHLAAGFAAENCRAIFCAEEKRCLPMLKGKACIHPNKGRPSMEAAGMDANTMAKNFDWNPVENGFVIYGLLMVA
jgi:predicted metal-binding protein